LWYLCAFMTQEMNSFPRIIYVYDALCGWCFGFKQNILRLHDEYAASFTFEVLSGNMVPVENKQHIGVMASYIAGAYQRVEEMTGCKFGEGYLHHIFNPHESELELSSEMPGLALTALKQLKPERAFEFAAALQNKMMVDGKDLSADEVYFQLAAEVGLDPTAFVESLHTEDTRDLAHAEFAMVKQLGITGFPCVLVQTDERKLYMVARGYTHYNDLKLRVDKVIEDYRIANN
jgi:putative protein-disulfide isomerase